ncbi:MAG: 3-dehydroquinate synthase, partial [Solirubrobacteraceae bacterium]
FRALDGPAHLVTDEHVGRLFGSEVAAAATVTVPAGETAKNLLTAGTVLEQLAGAGLDHDGHVVALGGGVVGDLAGFCAAVYQRGVPVVQMPTTLVAQVDSAYGGKTGVDLPQGKNYVGAYHQPAAVLADPSVLATLPAEELAAGWAEVVKTALIAGGPLWKRVRARHAEADRDLVLACARTKLAVVAADERDSGRRQALNLGHTVGHAIETVTGYSRYRHGEAVALGLLAALTLSVQPALRDEVADLLAAHGLPTRLDPAVDPAEVVAATSRDKKRRGGRVGFVLVEAPGDVRTGCAVADDDLRVAVGQLR